LPLFLLDMLTALQCLNMLSDQEWQLGNLRETRGFPDPHCCGGGLSSAY
jgi:hypothetical protein